MVADLDILLELDKHHLVFVVVAEDNHKQLSLAEHILDFELDKLHEHNRVMFEHSQVGFEVGHKLAIGRRMLVVELGQRDPITLMQYS
tara:strand:+ start:113 stop:376 length:264 start_codon:yes stop_codon:yes gene_type:complete